MRAVLFLALLALSQNLLVADSPDAPGATVAATNDPAFQSPDRTFTERVNLAPLFDYYKGFKDPATAPPHTNFPNWTYIKGKVLSVTSTGVVFSDGGKTSVVQHFPKSLKPGDEISAVVRKTGLVTLAGQGGTAISYDYGQRILPPTRFSPPAGGATTNAFGFPLRPDRLTNNPVMTREEAERRIEEVRRRMQESGATNFIRMSPPKRVSARSDGATTNAAGILTREQVETHIEENRRRLIEERSATNLTRDLPPTRVSPPVKEE
jgi:hypothetical protein